MGVVDKKIQNGKRVLMSRDKQKNIIFNDPDLIISVGYNLPQSTSGKVVFIDFKKQLEYIAARWNIGSNASRISVAYDTNMISKNLDSGVNGNPIEVSDNVVYTSNFIYIPNINEIEEMSLYASISNVFPVKNESKISAKKPFVNCKKLDFTNNGTGVYSIFPDFSDFLKTFPNVEYLRFRPTNSINSLNLIDLNNLHSLKFLYLTIYSGGVNGTHIFNYLPINLYFLYIYFLQPIECKLEDYFTGKRIALGLAAQNALQPHSVKYNGGAIFPSIIRDDAKYPVPYLIDFTVSIQNKLTGNELSSFLVDFANQVVQIQLTDPLAKSMKFRGSTPNTSYTDNSQPLFKTYASALAHITDTLGVTVQFT